MILELKEAYELLSQELQKEREAARELLEALEQITNLYGPLDRAVTIAQNAIASAKAGEKGA